MSPALLALFLAAAPPAGIDLSPLIGEGALAGAAAYEAGRFDEAAKRLAGKPEPGATFVRAQALLKAGHPAEALRESEGLEAKLPEIGDRIAMMRGDALRSEGHSKEALATFASVADGSPRSPDARLAWARIAAEEGDVPGAIDRLGPLVGKKAPSDPSRPDLAASALLLSARLHARAGEGDAARAAFLDCWAGHPVAPEVPECRAGLTALKGPQGQPPAPEDELRRAEGLLDANRNEAAMALLKPLLAGVATAEPSDSFACRTRVAAGRAFRRARSYDKAIEALRPVVASCPDPDVRVRALYLLASAASIAGDRDEAIRLYRRLAREYPAHPFADDALFYAADLLARTARLKEAREALAALVQEHPKGDFCDEARFRLAWLSRRAGDLDRAAAELLAIEETRRDDPYEHARAAYWRARVLAAGGDQGRQAARGIWADLVARYPADYYGLLSRARLAGTAQAALPVPIPNAPVPGEESAWDPGPLRDDPRLKAGLLLLRIGLEREAAEEFAAIDPARLGEAAAVAPEAVLLVADLLDRGGDHRSAHALLRTRARAAFRRPPEGEAARAWRIAYPPAYRDAVRRWAPTAGVPVDLVQALMREESALDPRAISPAGAVGLTQLMLPTARQIARELRLGKVSRDALTQPSLNIRLGARYLGALVRQYDGSIALALAAYNAGGGAVNRWLEDRRALEIDEFVEEIPVEETRGYVKRVLRSYAAYWLLYGGAASATESVAGLSRER